MYRGLFPVFPITKIPDVNLFKIGLKNFGVFAGNKPVDGFSVLFIIHFNIKTMKLKENDCLFIDFPFANVYTMFVQNFKLQFLWKIFKLR